MSVRMYCRSCCYELTGLDDPVVTAEAVANGTVVALVLRCPECGREYKPLDPRSWQVMPRSPTMQFIFGRGGAWFVAALMVLLSVWQTWLPRPDAADISLPQSMRTWTMWRWFGMRFGREVDRLRNPTIAVWYVADSATRITAYDDAGDPTWDITQLGNDRVRLRIHQPGMSHLQILGWLGNCQSWPQQRFRLPPNHRGRRAVSPGPGTYEGTWQELLPAVVSHFDKRLVPLVLSENQREVVVIDPATGLGRLVSIEAARAMGYDVSDVTDQEGGLRFGP